MALEYRIQVRRLKPEPMVAIRRRTAPDQIAETLRQIYAAIGAFLERKHVTDAGPPFTRYHGWDDHEVDVEGGLILKEPVEGEGDVYCGGLPGGLAVATTHVGDYDGLPRAHDAVRRWIQRNGKEPDGASWEVYRTDPAQTPDPGEWKTDVFCLILA